MFTRLFYWTSFHPLFLTTPPLLPSSPPPPPSSSLRPPPLNSFAWKFVFFPIIENDSSPCDHCTNNLLVCFNLLRANLNQSPNFQPKGFLVDSAVLQGGGGVAPSQMSVTTFKLREMHHILRIFHGSLLH